MHDSDQSPELHGLDDSLHRALDCMDSLLSLEQQRLRLQIARRQAASTEDDHVPDLACGTDAVIRLRRAA